MKTSFLIVIALASLSTFTSAAEFCKASKKTVTKISELRKVELPYKVVETQIVQALVADKCVRSKLQNEEIYSLTQLLLDFSNKDEASSAIIVEFIQYVFF